MCFLGSCRPSTLPLRILQFGLWVVSINDAFIACDDVQEVCGIVSHKFPSVPDRSLLDCLSDPGSTLSAQISLQSDACSAVLWEFADKIHNQFQPLHTDRVRYDDNPGWQPPVTVPLLRGCCRAWPTRSIIISSQSSAILEKVQTCQKFGYSSCTNHQNPVSSFQNFTSRFNQTHTELDAHPLFVNFRHTADIRKSQTADAIHT